MSRYRMIAREDLELKMKSAVAELETQRARMYHALDVLPINDFESRDALNHEIAAINHEIAASIGEQRAWRSMWDWVSENYRPEISQAQLKDQIDGVNS